MTVNSLFPNDVAHQRQAQLAVDVARGRTVTCDDPAHDPARRRHSRPSDLVALMMSSLRQDLGGAGVRPRPIAYPARSFA